MYVLIIGKVNFISYEIIDYINIYGVLNLDFTQTAF
jgi:hypothetical protein